MSDHAVQVIGVKIEEAQLKISLHRKILHLMPIKNCQRTMLI